jgi:uridine kinase
MKLIMVRGLPGSGKTTIGKQISKSIGDSTFMETDQYWKEDYSDFDVSKLKEAHQWCYNKTKDYFDRKFTVIVANTFTQQWEMQPYIDLAKEYNISIQVITCHGNFGSIHNVPDAVMEKMRNRFQHEVIL